MAMSREWTARTCSEKMKALVLFTQRKEKQWLKSNFNYVKCHSERIVISYSYYETNRDE